MGELLVEAGCQLAQKGSAKEMGDRNDDNDPQPYLCFYPPIETGCNFWVAEEGLHLLAPLPYSTIQSTFIILVL